MEYKKNGTIQKLHCNTCKLKTHHKLIAVHKRTHENLSMILEFRYNLWVCLGCDTATLEETHAGYLPYDGIRPKNSWAEYLSKENATWTSNLYPKREFSDLQPKHFSQLNDKLAQIYNEVIESFNSDSRILCAMGLRALLEGVCTDKGVKVDRNAKRTIDGLGTLLPSNIVEGLHGFRFIGNMAVHELDAPERRELKLAIEVLEGVMNFFYELEYKIQYLPKEKTLQEGDKND